VTATTRDPDKRNADAQPPSRGSRKSREARMVALGSLLFVGGMSIFYVMPAFLALLQPRMNLNAAELGTVAGVESLAIALTSLVAPLWVDRVDHRTAIFAAVGVFVAATIATAFCTSFPLLLGLRTVMGLFGEGVLGTLSFRVLGRTRDVDRAFAVALTAAVAFGAATTAAAASLERIVPAFGLLLALIAMAVVIIPFAGWSTLAAAPRTAERGARVRGGISAAAIALVGQALWFAAPGAFWTFAEQVATDKGLTNQTAEFLLSIGELVALVGSAVAAILADRLGRIIPIAFASLGLVASAVVFGASGGTIVLAACLAVFYAFWNYGAVYQMSFVTQLDRTGDAGVIMPAVQVIGMSAGPFATGFLIAAHGDSAVTGATLGFTAAGLALCVIAFAIFARPARARTSGSPSGSH
jgi:DHA1 family inner membrane transport protein